MCTFNFLTRGSNVDLDSAGTTSRILDKHSLTALTTGFALGFQYKAAGVYLASGEDLPFGRDSQEWNFFGMPWIRFGLGLKLE